MEDLVKTAQALRSELNRRNEAIEDCYELLRKIDEDPNKSGVRQDNNQALKRSLRDRIYQLSKIPELVCPKCTGVLHVVGDKE